MKKPTPPEEFPTFNWKELNGRSFTVISTEDEHNGVVLSTTMLYDTNTGELFVVAIEKVGA